MRRLLAFDWGLRHIGVAVGNELTRTAEPCTTLKARDGAPDWNNIEALLKEWRPDLILVGDPLNMDGSPSEMSGRACRFARQLEGRYQLPVAMVDERLSSRSAKTAARERGEYRDWGADTVDAEAAAIILQTWLNEPAD